MAQYQLAVRQSGIPGTVAQEIVNTLLSNLSLLRHQQRQFAATSLAAPLVS
jgi:hypothetical protein